MNDVFLKGDVVDDYIQAAGLKYSELSARLGFSDARYLRYLRARKNYASWSTVVLLADILNESVPLHSRTSEITPLSLIDGLSDPRGIYRRFIVAARLRGQAAIKDAEHLQKPATIWECKGPGVFPLFQEFRPVVTGGGQSLSAPAQFFEVYFGLFDYVPSTDEFHMLQHEHNQVILRTRPWLKHRVTGRSRPFECQTTLTIDAQDIVEHVVVEFDQPESLVTFHDSGR
ncbi:helix-turn-helix domain-containing protein [Calycomorphotria hydatis]|uniref:Uncharacterized protein n=1 Tax=Calycomorphotria hydatis TaxID=2528027 RepID=A0A517TEE4_9PLAN|nr:helix-turn-helix transcriptional regulator [Calycomorphotria hydatis]QDT66751.1 hypothetical protein V22_40220 [Calycomorphotria hydatis]